MSKYLVTFPGKYGDILWSLATAKLIAETVVGGSIDVRVMPQYDSICGLIGSQPWVASAGIIPNWICTGSPHGDQPWYPPMDATADYVGGCWHLGYQGHPGINAEALSLVDFVAWQQHFKFVKPPDPWLEVEDVKLDGIEHIAVAFNDDYGELKHRFKIELDRLLHGDVCIKYVAATTWLTAASMIKRAIGFVGDRSALKVLAHAVGQKNVICYEPHPNRNAYGRFGKIFGYPYGSEITWPVNVAPEDAALAAALQIRTWLKEKSNGTTETESRSMR